MLYFNCNSPFDYTWIVFNTIYSWIEGKGKNVTKKCYPCDNLDDIFPCNFWTEHFKAMKLGMMQKKTLITYLKINFNNKSALDSL